MMKIRILFFAACLCLLACQSDWPEPVADSLATLDRPIDYNFDIKPILADRCFACHGPDVDAREAELRLDIETSAKKALASGQSAIVAGKPGKSLLVKHMLSTDPDQLMPPPESNLHLSDGEKALLIAWIEQGAKYKKHWSFIAPDREMFEQVASKDQHPIDFFVTDRLSEIGLEASAPADEERLLRRLHMDLTGLPPALEDIDQFISSTNPNKYEDLVDELLASSAAAERLAMEWLDVARYADSHGMHADGWRNAWPWRDYVINAFQQNLPYDQFVTEQIAGDLLPNATLEQKIATAFHRNHPMTAEGGAIDEEFRLEYVSDRTNTTATAILGLTMECAKCHDHKYDPISQEDYYRMSAFFNNVKELGMTGDDGNYGPVLQLASPATRKKLAQLTGEIEEIKSSIGAISEELAVHSMPNLSRGLQAYLPMERADRRQISGREKMIIDGQPGFTSSASPTVVQGKVKSGLQFDEEYDALFLEKVGLFDVQDPFSFSAWVNTTKKTEGLTQVIAGNAGHKNSYWRGWDIYLDDQNRLNGRLIHALPDNYLHVRSTKSIELETWHQVGMTYFGTSSASDLQLYIDGQPVDQKIERDALTKNIRTIGSGPQNEVDQPLCVAKSYRSFTGENGVFQGTIDELRVYERAISPTEMKLLQDPSWQYSEQDLARHQQYIGKHDHAEMAVLRKLVKEKVAIHDTIQEIMVMEDMDQPRPTFVLNRGMYNQPLQEVTAGTPEAVLPFDPDLPTNRLGLAQWLFHQDNPLTARVTVNRYWQMIFGRGIVKSSNDFGVQGSLPSHPELLDWLAIYLQESGWDIKALLKTIVTSNTYQQSSVITPQHIELDPENIFLARSPSFRWPAEIIRDNALAAGGLLVREVGGPSVRPYQPEGLWMDKGTFSHKLLRYVVDSGDDLYRRSMYTFVKRTSPHPAMTIFDAPNRDVCTVKREVTNTPLQALVLLNDPQFVEASKAIALRADQEHPEALNAQLGNIFRLLTQRKASPSEMEALATTYESQLAQFEAEPSSFKSLLAVGEFETPTSAHLAALTMVANTVMNSDETYTRR